MYVRAEKGKGNTEYVTVPEIKTVEVPVQVPGTKEIVTVPQIIFIDKGFGITTLPRPNEQAPESLKILGHAVAKVMRIDGSSGMGFFISEDGLFLTNEHVVPIVTCKANGCPETKIVRNFSNSGSVSVQSSPKGFPMVKTFWPTFKSWLDPNGTGAGGSSAIPIFRTAIS